MNFTKAVPQSSFAIMSVSQKTFGRLLQWMGVVAASMEIFSNPLPGGASDEAGFLAAGSLLRAVLPQPGMAALPFRAYIQFFLQRHGAHGTHPLPAHRWRSRSLERVLRSRDEFGRCHRCGFGGRHCAENRQKQRLGRTAKRPGYSNGFNIYHLGRFGR